MTLAKMAWLQPGHFLECLVHPAKVIQGFNEVIGDADL
jgi:hypothetical protein